MSHAKVAKVVIQGGYPAERTSMDLPISREVLRIAESARGPVVKLPTMGGSVPLYMITKTLGSPTITVPIANHDNNQHSFEREPADRESLGRDRINGRSACRLVEANRSENTIQLLGSR